MQQKTTIDPTIFCIPLFTAPQYITALLDVLMGATSTGWRAAECNRALVRDLVKDLNHYYHKAKSNGDL